MDSELGHRSQTKDAKKEGNVENIKTDSHRSNDGENSQDNGVLLQESKKRPLHEAVLHGPIAAAYGVTY